jgi:hypothetical protein
MSTETPIGDLLDRAWELRETRKLLEAQVADIEKQEKAALEEVLNRLSKDQINGARGTRCSAFLDEKDVPQVKDWSAFYKYIQTTGDFDLLQKRPGEKACALRWENGEQLPGVEKFHVVKVSLRTR